jgi:hypothetical protein
LYAITSIDTSGRSVAALVAAPASALVPALVPEVLAAVLAPLDAAPALGAAS